MKKALVIAVAALFIAAVIPAQASARHTMAHRVATLETRVNALQTRVNQLYSFTHNCLAFDWWPLTSYGDWEGNTFGYSWTDSQGTMLTSAVDITFADDPVDFYVAAINPSCLSSVARVSKTLRDEASALSLRR